MKLLYVDATRRCWWLVNIGAVNGLVNGSQVNATEHLWWYVSQHCFRQWPGAIRQQAITWAKVDPDLCCHMALLGHNDLTLDMLQFVRKYGNAFAFYFVFQNWCSAGSWNPSFWKTRTALSYFVKTMADAESPGYQQPWYWLHSVHNVMTWKHFPTYWPFVPGINRSPASDAELWCFLWSVPE